MKIAARCVAGEECGMRQGKPGGVVKGDQVGPGHLQFLEHQKQVRFQKNAPVVLDVGLGP